LFPTARYGSGRYWRQLIPMASPSKSRPGPSFLSDEELNRVRSAGDFLTAAVQARRRIHSSFGYAQLARKAGFSSRGYVRDLALGTKKFTPASLKKVSLALNLDPLEREFFLCLGALQRTEGSSELVAKIEKLRTRILGERRSPSIRQNESFFRTPSWPYIYAALGSITGEGVVLAEVARLARCSVKECDLALRDMLSRALVERNSVTGRWRALNPHLLIQGIKEAGAFTEFYRASLLMLSARIDEAMAREDSLIHGSVFSVRRDRMPALKRELQVLLTRYADESEDSEGDALATLLCALTPR